MTWRWGIIGPGGIATQFATGMAMVGDGELTAVASRALARADAFADRFAIPHRYDRVGTLVDDPDVDVVYVATPHAQHMDATLAALDAGKHVLCEKPLALSARQAQLMADRARARGRFLMEAMWSRFLPSYVALRDVLSSGRLGEPLLVEADFGFRAAVQPSHRHFDLALGGGATLDLGVYPVQLCSLVLGPPSRVAADGVTGETGVDEQVAAVFHHPGGALGVVKAAIRVAMACSARIACTDGTISLPPLMHCPDHIDVTTAHGTERIDGGWQGEGLRFQVHEVHRCLDEGRSESAIMPLDESVSIASTMDAMLAAVGVEYPNA